MKLTQEILDSGKWLNEDTFKVYGGWKYRKLVCEQCGKECLSAANIKQKIVFCDQECFRKFRIGKPSSLETNQKISKSNIGKVAWNKDKELSEEHKRNIGIAKKGKPSPRKGKPSSNKGIPLSQEHKNAIGNAKKGVPLSELHKQHISEGGKGITHSEERRKRAGDAHRCLYTSNNIPKYDLYVHQLEPYEECKRSKRDSNVLRVRCTYCGKWFIPSLRQVGNRIRGINDNDTSRFYCSDSCKVECPIYKKRMNYKGQKGFNSREVQPELRQLVFLRDKYECQKCGSKESLHCHHYEGIEHNPIESADVDMCITLCKDCHKEVHSTKGCRYYDLRGCKEENQSMVVI